MRIAAAVLAAGNSSRLGRPKQLVAHRGSTLLGETVRCATANCSEVAVVLGARAEELAPALADWSVGRLARLHNPQWHEGMASSVRTAARWMLRGYADALLLLVCDQPRLTAAYVRELAHAYRDTRTVVASRYADRLGVPAVFPRSQVFELLALRGDAGARSLLAQQPQIHVVDWPDGELDVDRPEQLASLA
jgi:molybdenum cofactor cytidylyltransferase